MNKNWTPSDFLDDENPDSKNPQKVKMVPKNARTSTKEERESGFIFHSETDTEVFDSANTPAPDTSFMTSETEVPTEEKTATTWVFESSADSKSPFENLENESLEVDDEVINPAPPQEGKMSGAGNVFDWIKSFLFSLIAVIFIFTLLFRGVTVNGNSMLPTLHNKEYLIISDLAYTPKTGDIVVVQAPNYKEGKEPLIKRVIATEGQKVKINFLTWTVWVNGVELNETYILKDEYNTMNREDLKPDENGEVEFTVADDCVFLMGDNRNDSLDSRSNLVGQIENDYIMGRVIIRITPFSKFGKVD